jgi:hypothetical protein
MSLVSVFVSHFSDFVADILSVFPEDVDLLAAQQVVATVRSTNPKLLVKIWKQHVAIPYRQPIEDGNMAYFLDKDYASDVQIADNAAHLLKSIDRLRDPIRRMSPENQAKTMQYIQNLTTLCFRIA